MKVSKAACTCLGLCEKHFKAFNSTEKLINMNITVAAITYLLKDQTFLFLHLNISRDCLYLLQMLLLKLDHVYT